MADINLTQVIHNVKEAYVDLTGDTDDITYGNISTKISEIQTGGGITGGYTVTFKVEGNDYYIASCQQGEAITEPPTPSVQGKNFGGWQLNGVDITFPYTPTADVEVAALLTTKNYLAANNEAITVMRGFTFSCRNLVTGAFGNKDLVGYGLGSDGMTGVFLITKVSRNNAIERTPSSLFADATSAITYNGETYYYARLAPFAGSEADTSGLNRFQITNGLTNDEAATEILAAFYSEAT